MPVRQLDAPCWKPCGPGEKPDDRQGPHFTAEQAAEYADPGETPVPFPSPCWTVVCDGLDGAPCGVMLEDEDEGWFVHLGSPAERPSGPGFSRWSLSADGRVRCPDCVSEARLAGRV